MVETFFKNISSELNRLSITPWNFRKEESGH